jgi:tRNA(Ile)-lysidine synthase
MRPRSGDLLRPLLAVSREEVLAHLRLRGLAWREDPTNADPAHRRNRVRHELLPYLEQRFNPRVREALARAAGLLADEAAFIRAEGAALLARVGREQGGVLSLRRASLAAAPRAVAREALRQALARTARAPLPSAQVERVLQLARRAEAAGRALPLAGGWRAVWTREELRVEKRPAGAAKALSSR